MPCILFAMCVAYGFTYEEEVRSGDYIIKEVQGLGENMIYID